MHSFKDTEGRLWDIAINVTSIKHVRTRTKVDLLDLADGQLFVRLAEDPILLCNILFALCEAKAEERKISDEDFGRGLAGDVIEAATVAFMEELADFFPSRRGKLLRRVLAEIPPLEEARLNLAEAKLDALLLQLKTSGAPSGSSPAPSASIPAPGPSAT